MTKAEQTLAILEARKRFYAWEPPGNQFSSFRCQHQQSCMIMTEAMCEARAGKPEIFREDCGGRAHRRQCPRWEHYSKEVKSAERQTHKALIENLNPQPLRRK